jgi:phenylpropionate dioxygenase-like ring-hydroxylating dioxygenase large terminal subunit
MTEFLRNSWYVGAWSNEITRSLLARTLLDTPVVFFRQEDGRAVALLDRCPHRFAPLSMGRLKGDAVECGYHGLAFDCTGACVRNPHSDVIPAAARVRSFPLVERYDAVWIWMGDPQRADAALIPNFDFLDDKTHRRAVRGFTHVQANYLLEADNLLDLSHIDFVHSGSIGAGAMYEAGQTVTQSGTTINSDWWCPNVPCLPNFEPALRANGRPTDHWLDMRWDAPGVMKLDVGVTLAGQPRSEGVSVPQGHFLTPETSRTTHYFWVVSRSHAIDSAEYDEIMLRVTRNAFENEDRPLLEAIQRSMQSDDFWAGKPALLSIDNAAVRARRLMEKLIAAEREADTARREPS